MTLLRNLMFKHQSITIGWFETDPFSESRIEKPHPVYVPRDETFEEIKQNTFSAGRLKALLHNLIPSIAAALASSDIPFKCFSDIDGLYNDGVLLVDNETKEVVKSKFLPDVMKELVSTSGRLLKYEIPAIISSTYYYSSFTMSTCWFKYIDLTLINIWSKCFAFWVPTKKGVNSFKSKKYF